MSGVELFGVFGNEHTRPVSGFVGGDSVNSRTEIAVKRWRMYEQWSLQRRVTWHFDWTCIEEVGQTLILDRD